MDQESSQVRFVGGEHAEISNKTQKRDSPISIQGKVLWLLMDSGR